MAEGETSVPMLFLQQILARPLRLIDPYLPLGGQIVLAALPKIKTFVALHWACCVATGHLASGEEGEGSLHRAGKSGTMCGTPFFVRVLGMVQVARSSESSAHVMPATSSRRWPVSKSRMMAP